MNVCCDAKLTPQATVRHTSCDLILSGDASHEIDALPVASTEILSMHWLAEIKEVYQSNSTIQAVTQTTATC